MTEPKDSCPEDSNKKRRVVLRLTALTVSIFKDDRGGNTKNASFCCQSGCDA
jgi:hypothetical protein